MPNWREIPFFRFLLPFIAGIACAMVLDISFPYLPYLIFFIAILILLTALRHFPFPKRWIFGIPLNIFLFLFGYQSCIQHNELRNPEHFQQYLQKENKLLVLVEETASGSVHLSLKARALAIQKKEKEWNDVEGKLLLYLAPSSQQEIPTYRDTLLIQGKVHPIAAAKNPEAFDFKKYQHFQNTHYQAFIKADHWLISGKQDHSTPAILAYKLRDRFKKTLSRYLPTDNEFGVAAALILGYRDELTDKVKKAYAGTGAMHVLAVSGLHVGFIYLGLAALLSLIRIRHKAWRIIRTLILIFGVWAFAFITGASPSVLRAATMFSFIIFGRALFRHTNIYNTLALSAFGLLFFNPYLLAEVGFQLSYLAVLGIVSFQPWIYRLWIIDNPVGDYIWKLMAVSIAAQITTLPISLFYFHQFPLYFWLSGLVVVPAAMLILALGILLFIADLVVPLLAGLLGSLLYGILWLVNAAIYMIQQLPGALIQGVWIGLAGMILLYLLLLFWIWIFQKEKKYRLPAFLFSLLILLAFSGWQNVTRWNQKQMVIYHVNKKSMVDIIEGKSLNSFMAYEIKEKEENFAAQNWRWKSGLQNQQKKPFGLPLFRGKEWCYKQGFLQFSEKRFGFIKENHIKPGQKLRLDYLFLYDNPKVSIKELQLVFDFHTLIADASTPPWNVAKWQLECDLEGINLINTHETGAHIFDFNRNQQ